MLLADDLIPVPPDFYDEDLYNDDVSYISEIFSQLEDKNLNFIKKMQEAEKNLEKRKHDFADLQEQKDKEIGILRENLAKHQDDLRQGEAQLAFLKKQSQMSAAEGPDKAKAKTGKKGSEEEQEPDIHQLMLDIEQAIQKAHNVMDGSQPLDGKEPMDLLQVSLTVRFF